MSGRTRDGSRFMRRVAAIGLGALAMVVASPLVAVAHNAPLNPYRWVNPPPDVKAANAAQNVTNEPPSGCDSTTPATPDRIELANVWTQDGQAVISFPDAPLPHRVRTSISVAMTPLDAATLGVLPAGLVADGNALHVVIQDGDTELAPLSPAATLIMFVPHQTGLALYSADGRTWSKLDATSLAERDSQVTYGRSGYYLMVADHPLTGGTSSTTPTGVIVAVVVIPPIALGAVLLMSRRRRGRGEMVELPT